MQHDTITQHSAVAGFQPQPPPLEGLMDPKTCAKHLTVSVLTLSDWRVKNIGPDFLKIGSAVRYRVSDVQRWLDSRLRKSN